MATVRPVRTSASGRLRECPRLSAKYGDAAPRQASPNANRGDSLTVGSPYQDRDPTLVDPATKPGSHSIPPPPARRSCDDRPTYRRGHGRSQHTELDSSAGGPARRRRSGDPRRARGRCRSAGMFALRDLAHDIANHLLMGFAPPKLQVAGSRVHTASVLPTASIVIRARSHPGHRPPRPPGRRRDRERSRSEWRSRRPGAEHPGRCCR
jgi:hypothetical protein